MLVKALPNLVLPRELSDEMEAAPRALVVPVQSGPPPPFFQQLLMAMEALLFLFVPVQALLLLEGPMTLPAVRMKGQPSPELPAHNLSRLKKTGK